LASSGAYRIALRLKNRYTLYGRLSGGKNAFHFQSSYRASLALFCVQQVDKGNVSGAMVWVVGKAIVVNLVQYKACVMGRIWELIRQACTAMIVVAALALVPAASEASGICFRNDTPVPVYVQTSTFVNGQIRRGPPIFLKPGQTAWDVNLMKGNLTIAVYTTGNLKLFQETRLFPGHDLSFSILPVIVPRGQPPRADLRELPLMKK
jgi:hypothetical protein